MHEIVYLRRYWCSSKRSLSLEKRPITYIIIGALEASGSAVSFWDAVAPGGGRSVRRSSRGVFVVFGSEDAWWAGELDLRYSLRL
jgi:hypothetical protein